MSLLRKIKYSPIITLPLIAVVPFFATACGSCSNTKENSTKLIIDGNQEDKKMTISSTFNLAGSYQFTCHTDCPNGKQPTVTWRGIPNNASVSIDSSGLLSWDNNLDPETPITFAVTCSAPGLEEDSSTVTLVSNKTPGTDLCPNSWLDLDANDFLYLKDRDIHKNNVYSIQIPSVLGKKVVKGIAANGFSGVESLLQLFLNQTPIIEQNAFKDCPQLHIITGQYCSEPQIGDNAFSNVHEDGWVHNYNVDYDSNDLLTKLKDKGLPDGWGTIW